MSLRKAQKHMRRATELLNQGQLGFGGGEKRKLESPEEGIITCYADADVLKMLRWEPKQIDEFGMNLEPLKNGKECISANTSSLLTITHREIGKDYITDCVNNANLMLVTHDMHNQRNESNMGSIRGFAFCIVDSWTLLLDLIGSSKKQNMVFRNSKEQIGGGRILKKVIRLGSKMKKGIELFAVAQVIPWYYGSGFRFISDCNARRADGHENAVQELAAFVRTSPRDNFQSFREHVEPFSEYGKSYYKILGERGKEAAQKEGFDYGYKMILCPAKNRTKL